MKIRATRSKRICKNCKYWKQLRAKAGECTLMEFGSKHLLTMFGEDVAIDNRKAKLDGLGAKTACLSTASVFGCNHFESKAEGV